MYDHKYTCWANSRVGAKISAWQSLNSGSSCCNIEMANVAVLPVPDCAWAITSWPKCEQKINKKNNN